MKIKAFRFVQKGVPVYATVISAKDIVDVMRYDRFGVKNPEGYQRDLEEIRVRKAVRFLEKEEGTFPTSVLMNYRGNDLNFKKDETSGSHEFGTLTIPHDELYVMDGQHRLATLQRAIADKPEFEAYPVIASIFNFTEQDRFNEMRQFYLVNSRQKSVPTDLAFKFLTKLYERHGEVEVAAREGMRKVLQAQADEIVFKINKASDSPWKNTIEMIGSTERGVIGEKTMAISISENILNQRIFVAVPKEELAKKLIEYWKAISDVYSVAFSSPESYTLQKTPGVYAFHYLFPSVYVQCLDKGEYSAPKVKEMLMKLREPPSPIIDDDWWHVKKGNPLALGTSKKLFRSLARELAKKIGL